MVRRLYRDVKAQLARIAGTTGFALNDARFLGMLNTATEELMNEGDWPGVVDRYKFAAYEGTVSLPGDLDRVMGIAKDYTPVEMRSPWFEFEQGGPGPQDAFTGLDVLLDRGEAATFRDIPNTGGPWTLRITADQIDERVDGARPKIRVLGYKTNGDWVRTEVDGEMIDGAEFEIKGDASPYYVDSDFTWAHIEAVIKPVTKGFVRLWITDGTDTLNIAQYAPRETLPSYRRYFLPNVSSDEASNILLRCRRRFVPVTGDNDFLIISNIAALECMMLAVQGRATDNTQKYVSNKALAVELLKKEARANSLDAWAGNLVRSLIWVGVAYLVIHWVLPSLAQEFPGVRLLQVANKAVKSVTSAHE